MKINCNQQNEKNEIRRKYELLESRNCILIRKIKEKKND